MPLDLRQAKDNVVIVRAAGTLTGDDYRAFVVRMDRMIERRGPLRVLFQMEELDGWAPGAAWEELAFQLRHRNDVTRVAVVGERRWIAWAATLSGLLTSTEVRHFDAGEGVEARTWVEASEA